MPEEYARSRRESTARGVEAVNDRIEAEAARAATRKRRLDRVVSVAYFGAGLVVYASVLEVYGVAPGVAAVFAYYLAFGAPLYRVRSAVELVADRPAGAVREELHRPLSPLTVLWLDRAEEATAIPPGEVAVPPATPDGDAALSAAEAADLSADREVVAAARVRVTSLWVFAAEYRVVVTDEGGTIHVRLLDDGDLRHHATVSTTPEGDRTRLHVEARRCSRFRARELLLVPLRTRFQRRIFEAYGYEVVETDTHVGI